MSEEDFHTAAQSLPFLADRRLVVVEQAQARFNAKEAEERYAKFLTHLPESTALVLEFPDEYQPSGRDRGWRVLSEKHWLWRWMDANSARAHYKVCRLPAREEMPDWIMKKAEALGGKFTRAGAQALADHTASETQVALREIEKLLTYVDYARAVEMEDVELLTVAEGPLNVFDMVDALADGRGDKAMRLLRGLLDQGDAMGLFGMVIRQFRLLIQAREILDEGGGVETIAREMGQANFVARKLAGQAPRFTLTRLRQAYHRLLELDEGVKSSQWTLELALEMFVAELK